MGHSAFYACPSKGLPHAQHPDTHPTNASWHPQDHAHPESVHKFPKCHLEGSTRHPEEPPSALYTHRPQKSQQNRDSKMNPQWFSGVSSPPAELMPSGRELG